MISRILFESPFLWVVVWFPCQVVLLVIWSRRRSRVTARAVWVWIALLPVMLLLQKMVTTQREEIKRLCREMAAYAENGDVPAIGRCLAPEFEAADLDVDQFLERLENRLTQYSVERPRLTGFDVSIDHANRGTAVFMGSAFVRGAETYGTQLTARFRLIFRKSDDRWLLVEIEVLPSPLSPFDDLRQLVP
jgi:hypothetical protein